MKKTIGYLRVSTREQNLENSKAGILKFANNLNLGQVLFVEEKVSGKINWKERKIFTVIEELNDGDTLITSEFSRLGRNMMEILEIINISIQKGIKVYVVKGAWTLENTLQSKLIAFAFSLAAEIEGDLISARTKEALASRKASGLPMGRPKGLGKSKLDQHEAEIRALLATDSSQKFIANHFGCSEPTVWHWMKRKGLK